MHLKKIFAIFLLTLTTSHAIEVGEKKEALAQPIALPWLTGPLLAPSATTVPLGSFNVEPYVYLTGYPGVYNSDWKVEKIPFFWNYALQVPIQFGIAPFMSLTFIPNGYYSQVEHQSSFALGDTEVVLNIQIWNESTYVPAIKLAFVETFPTGKYDHLNPKKLQTDAGGAGSYVTTIGLVFGKLIHVYGIHYITARLTGGYDIPTPVNVRGFNTFGGDKGTKGTYYPPQGVICDLGLEYSLSQRWALALDVLFTYYARSKFKGITGAGTQSSGSPISGNDITGRGGTPTMVSGAAVQWSLAPAIEYNWSQNWGLIAGCWFTVAGRNTSVFQSGVIAINYFK